MGLGVFAKRGGVQPDHLAMCNLFLKCPSIVMELSTDDIDTFKSMVKTAVYLHSQQ